MRHRSWRLSRDVASTKSLSDEEMTDLVKDGMLAGRSYLSALRSRLRSTSTRTRVISISWCSVAS